MYEILLHQVWVSYPFSFLPPTPLIEVGGISQSHMRAISLSHNPRTYVPERLLHWWNSPSVAVEQYWYLMCGVWYLLFDVWWVVCGGMGCGWEGVRESGEQHTMRTIKMNPISPPERERIAMSVSCVQHPPYLKTYLQCYFRWCRTTVWCDMCDVWCGLLLEGVSIVG